MMETQLLHLMDVGMLGVDLCNNITDYLRELLREDSLAAIVDPVNRQTPDNPTISSWHDPTRSLEDHYEMGPGLCIIINQKTFYVDNDPSATKLDDRLGTDRDRDEFEATFTMFGAEVVIHDNLDHKQLDQALNQAAKKANNKKYYWLVVCILSHGRRHNGVDEILGCNGVAVNRNDIILKFVDSKGIPNLHLRPKMFFFQACRGAESQQGVPKRSLETIRSDNAAGGIDTHEGWPNRSDFLVSSATIEDFVSFRSTEHGSFFIRILCDELQKNGHKVCIQDILTTVNRRVASHKVKPVTFCQYDHEHNCIVLFFSQSTP
jgi:hypothetical protein